MYQHYHQSAGINTFCTVLRNRYKVLSKQRYDAEIVGANDKQVAVLAKKYSGFLNYQIMCRKETLLQKIKHLSTIKNIQFEYSTLEVNKDDELAPLLSVAKKRNERLMFSKSNADLVKQAVLDFVGKFAHKKLRLEGIDPDGHEQVYKLLNDHDTFEEFDYDTVLESIDIDSKKLVDGLHSSLLMTRIFEVAQKKAKALLTTPAA